MTGHVPVARPLPHIADHVEEPVAVRGKAADRRGACIAVLFGIVDGKDALPGIGDGLAILVVGLAPILAVIFAAARGIFPLSLGGKLTPEPMRVSQRILISDMDNGMVLPSFDG